MHDVLRRQLAARLAAVFRVPPEAAAEWGHRVPGLAVLDGDKLTAANGLADRALARVDAMLDRQLGYHPLAMRLNHRHGFHAERMQPGHPNWMLDTNRDSRLPHRPSVDRAMKLGYAWKWGPFELIDRMGAAWFAEKLAAEGRPVPPLLAAAAKAGGF